LGAGVRYLMIANRTFERARLLADALGPCDHVGLSQWSALGRGAPFDLIINATSAGVHHARLVLPPSLATAHTVAYDLSYGRAAEEFVGWARAVNCAAAHDGLGMLVETAAASFARWHGVRPDTESALRTLGNRASRLRDKPQPNGTSHKK
jgi:shikimate dehydrogenase